MTTQSHPPNHNECVYNWIKQYQEHEDEDVQTLLVNHYKKLVESLARKYSKGKNIHEDLVQVGMIGLLGAIRRFDQNYGGNFESFAIPTILGEIKRFIRDKTWSVHVPRRVKELGPKLKKSVELLTEELQRSPKVEEIAQYLNVSEEEILETMEMSKSYRALSVDSKIESDYEGGSVTLLDLIGEHEIGYQNIDRSMLVEKILSVLSERERDILRLTYFENLSQKETGEKLNISQMHVSRLQRRALKKLRELIQHESQEYNKIL
ncbi:RNA polymerase sigma factor SigB [Bacillus sp. Marseille-P3661]|uniref:RNA polymerase sigma factor SigB n=1 Tax=Bacillus sp. Marseille-P3661 TaxID=1936234 RepID=UPI002155613A|nr:RNA polymerase sigma factor SigB [Bacillus sp. Marseille-P3661]